MNFARFMGWYLSEGCTTKRSDNCYQVKISQSKKKYHSLVSEDIKNLLENSGIPYYI